VNSRRSWLIFAITAFAYLVAVTQRSSLGVAAVEATDRFDIAAAALSSLTVVQLIVYAALQVPVGVAVDRVGPRTLIALGAALMLVGQVTLALAPNLAIAVVGRVLVGGGDAFTFISAIRLLASWFHGRSLPIASQWLGTIGQFGQVLSALPFSLLLHFVGWTPAFLSAGGLSLVAGVLVILLVKSRPNQMTATAPVFLPEAIRERPTAFKTLKESLARPGTQLGFWSHFVSQSSVTVFVLLWGFPFLSIGLGYGPQLSALLLTTVVFTGVVSGPVLGVLTARHPLRRSNIVLGIVFAMAIAWALVLLWPGKPPLAIIMLLLIVISVGGPGSLIGFDFARTFNPLRALGSASGVVNVGGFLASFVLMFVIGLVLDVIDRSNGGNGIPEELYSLDAFRIAFSVQYLVVGIGVVFLVCARRATRKRMHEEEGIEVAPLWVVLGRAWRRRR
jgi:sugar phosphate permease